MIPNSFFDEMEKISASLLLNAGNPIKFTTRAANYLKGMAGHAGNTLKTMATDPIGGMRRGAAFTANDLKKGSPFLTGLYAVGTGSDINDAVKKKDPEGRNRSRLARSMQAAGNLGGGLIGAPFGSITGGLVGSAVGSTLGGLAGRGVDKIRGRQWTSPKRQAAQP